MLVHIGFDGESRCHRQGEVQAIAEAVSGGAGRRGARGLALLEKQEILGCRADGWCWRGESLSRARSLTYSYRSQGLHRLHRCLFWRHWCQLRQPDPMCRCPTWSHFSKRSSLWFYAARLPISAWLEDRLVPVAVKICFSVYDLLPSNFFYTIDINIVNLVRVKG